MPSTTQLLASKGFLGSGSFTKLVYLISIVLLYNPSIFLKFQFENNFSIVFSARSQRTKTLGRKEVWGTFINSCLREGSVWVQRPTK